MTLPLTLDHAGIAARVPHRGRMCLLDSMSSWSADEIRYRVTSHRDADNPLRGPQGLLATCAIEYAAQAMALHGALGGGGAGSSAGAGAPSSGFIASGREVRLHVPRLDTIAGALALHAYRVVGDTHQALYRFTVHDEHGALLVDGRVTVVLDTPVALR